MENGRGSEEQAVEAVKQTAVSREGGGPIFDAEVALDGGKGEIAELTGDAENHADENEPAGIIHACVGKTEMAENGGESGREHQSPERAAEGFVRAGIGRQFSAAERFADDVGKDIIHLD